MAIIIDMEMPNGCCECRMERENCCTLSLRKIDDIFTRPTWCKLRESKHGQWIWKDDPYEFFDKIPVCSECGHTPIMRKTSQYCPYCGVKMDEAENEKV